MFENLRNTLFVKNISIMQFAEFLGVTEKTAQNKLQNKTDFTYPEFKRICNLLLPEYRADWLFEMRDTETKQPA